MAEVRRRKSESRLRQKLVGVRMSPAEHALLAAESARSGRSESSILRDAFLASVTPQPEAEPAPGGGRDA